ncbi:MAG: hypothetical protein IJ035_03045 [Oscillospiraceae bacterium]|nr:hypothetical protein [Oscillospiraceae bacterium]
MKLFKNKIAFMYLLVFVIIGVGFCVGNGYKIYNDNQGVENINPSYINSKYKLLVNGWIDKYEGWYGLSWKNTYICYIKLDVNDENFELYCELLENECPEEYANWTEANYIDYLINMSAGDEYTYKRVYAKFNNNVVMIELDSINVTENHKNAIPKIIAICAMLLLLPILLKSSILK